MADYGNDPTIGHSQHTREYVPLLILYQRDNLKDYWRKRRHGRRRRNCNGFFKVDKPKYGCTFLVRIKSKEA